MWEIPRVPLTLDRFDTICCDMPKTKTKSKETDDPELIRGGHFQWWRPSALVRAKGILQEIHSRLPSLVRKSLDIQAGGLILVMPETSKTEFRATASAVSSALDGIADLPVIPREIEDILTITASAETLARGRPSAQRRNANNQAARARKEHHLSPICPPSRRRSARPWRRG